MTTVFTDFIAEDIRKIESSQEFKKAKELGYLKSNFKESDEVKIEVSDEEAKKLALGIAIYLSGVIKDQNLDIFNEYISAIQKNGVDIGNTKLFDLSPLSIAALMGHHKVVETLLSHGADVNMPDKAGKTPLFFAAKNGHDEVVTTLLSHGSNVNMPNKNGVTPLFFAAQNGHNEVVETLLKHRADMNMSNKNGVTPLFFAAQNGHDEVVKTFLSHGANADLNSIAYLKKENIDIDMSAKDGSTLLLRAVKNNQTDIAEVLLEAKADPNKANSKNSTTPLQEAIATKNPDIVKLITKYALKAQSITNLTVTVPSTHLKSNSKTMER